MIWAVGHRAPTTREKKKKKDKTIKEFIASKQEIQS